MLFLWGFNFFSKLASIRLFRLHEFFSLFFFMTALFYLPLNFSNGPSIAVKLLMANLLVLVITYCVNVTNMYI